MFNRLLTISSLLTLGALVLAPAAHAEPFAFQVVCKRGSTTRHTPWVDERISRVAFFDRARAGIQFHDCQHDCGPFGPYTCGSTPITELSHYYPWTERFSAVACDDVCLNVRAVDGSMNSIIATSDYTRYATQYNGASVLSWWVQSHGGATPHDVMFEHHSSSGTRDGYIFCWNGRWITNYLIAKYDAMGAAGRKTVFTLTDTHGVAHQFTVAGYLHDVNYENDQW